MNMPVMIVPTDSKSRMDRTVVAMNGITKQTYESAIETMTLLVVQSSCVGLRPMAGKESG